MRRLALVAGLSLLAAWGPATAAQAGARAPATGPPYVLTVRTVPPLAGTRFLLAGRPFVSGRDGVARISVARRGTYALRLVAPGPTPAGERVRFERWGDDAFHAARTVAIPARRELEVGFEVERRIVLAFRDLDGKSVDAARVASVTLGNSLGVRDTFRPGSARWVVASRVARRINGLEQTPTLYSVLRVDVDGANTVNQNQQRFFPLERASVVIRLLLYSARISARDLVFGFPIGRTLQVTLPNGQTRRLRLDGRSELRLDSLARGTYGLRVNAGGISPDVPLAMTKDQVVVIKVASYLDLAFAFGALTAFAATLLLARRPRLRARLRPRSAFVRRTPSLRGAAFVAAAAVLLGATATVARAADGGARGPVPVLAYYYIWFDEASWRRGKSDYPLLGRYSSDDEDVMRRHIEWAKHVGIDGFIVSWKSTPVLNERLEQLVALANEADFKLVIIYQGLDFYREPLEVDRIADDLDFFAETFGGEPAFNLFAGPVVIWSGTWRFTRAQVARVAADRRDGLLLLASERSARSYDRIADLVNGNAYYWSSVDPETFPGYPEKLAAMGTLVHRRGGLWIAPAAPGFDARLVGGTRVVERHGGETLRRQLNAALRSSPDAVGVISWNEFSENSHVEPSKLYGHTYLHVLGTVLGTRFPTRTDLDSSDPPGADVGYAMPLLIGCVGVFLTGVGAVFWRREVRRVVERSRY